MSETDPRVALRTYAAASGASLSALSRMLGRNVAYLQQYVARGSPQRLPERERRLLADYFGVAEARLGAPAAAPSRTVAVPRLAVAASAGPGSLIDREIMLGADAVDRRLLRQLGVAPEAAAMLRVRGTSMEPGLFDGDWVLIDTAAVTATRAGAGVHVVRIDDAVMVKRLTLDPDGFTLSSDNPDAPPIPVGTVQLLGRVVWQMRATR